MRILHVIPHYWPAVRYGGPIRSVHGLAAATAALGHEVHVYTTNVDGDGVLDVATGRPVDRDGVKVWYFPISFGRKVFRSAEMGRKLEESIGDFDIVHIHYVWVWPTVVAAAAARRHNVPYVLAPRGMLVADLIRRRSALAKRIWLLLFDRRNVERAAAIHVTAEAEAQDVRALGLAAQRICIIPNGIDLDSAHTAVGDRAIDATATPSEYVLFLGRISWKKGLDRLIPAMAKVRSADLVIAGYDEAGYQTQVERLVADAGLTGRIRFHGPAEDEAKWALIRGARCLVLPSYHENFGMSALEAMAVGCPVVVTEEVGLADVITKSGSGLAVEGTPEALATAIDELLEKPDMARSMGLAGERTVRETFSWTGIAKRMVALYDECRKT